MNALGGTNSREQKEENEKNNWINVIKFIHHVKKIS